MRISVLTIFPEEFQDFQRKPIVARAVSRGLLTIEIIDIKDFASGSFRHIDDSPFGGGAGMLMRCEPVFGALRSVHTEDSWTILTSPAGKPYTQQRARQLAGMEHLILLCGHYEGMDARIEEAADEAISVGDYVLTGGELPAMVIMDSIARLLGTIREASTEEESYEQGLLEYPQYTRPADFEGRQVPEVLLSGHAERIRRWRLKESLRRTLAVRPDLLQQRALSSEEKELLEEIREEESSRQDQ